MSHFNDIAATLPESFSHMLLMNWGASPARPDMAYSVEDETYIALYGVWTDPARDDANVAWVTDRMREMEDLASGIQLADENLGLRPARFVSAENLARLDEVAELLRDVGPSVVVTILLDGPQLASRWTARYASVLADDPGTAVLTLTASGLLAVPASAAPAPSAAAAADCSGKKVPHTSASGTRAAKPAAHSLSQSAMSGLCA